MKRPDSPTRVAIRRLRQHDPDITAAAMAREVGVSKTRVAVVLKAMGLPTTTARSFTGLPDTWQAPVPRHSAGASYKQQHARINGRRKRT